MELTPIFELNSLPRKCMWHVLSAIGDSPTMRVGHTATFLRNEKSVVFVGGANPDSAFAEHHVLCLKTMSWDRVEGPPQLARYEHAAFVTGNRRPRIHVFGGANKNGNVNEVVYLDVRTCRWKSLTQLLSGTPPCPRTYHAGQDAFVNDHLVVFSGGLQGTQPVNDRQVHRLCVTSRKWEILQTSGEPPSPRQGHAVAATDSAFYVHAGMRDSEFLSCLHRLCLRSCRWQQVTDGGGGGGGGVRPCGRAGHGAVVWKARMYVFGGIAQHGALNDLYYCDLDTHQWSQVTYVGDPPQCRLDFALCICDIEVRAEGEEELESSSSPPPPRASPPPPPSASASASAASASANQRQGFLVTCLMINGGMDGVGNIFDDTMVFPLAIRRVVSEDA